MKVRRSSRRDSGKAKEKKRRKNTKEKTGNVYNDGIFMILGISVLAFMLICILLYKFNIVRYILIALIAVFAVIFRKKLIYAFKKALNK